MKVVFSELDNFKSKEVIAVVVGSAFANVTMEQSEIVDATTNKSLSAAKERFAAWTMSDLKRKSNNFKFMRKF